MRRAVARGRILPQSLSTDPRYGRVSLKAQVLYPLMWVNADDQGRLSGDPDEIKYAACPNVDNISKLDIPELLKELGTQGLIEVYNTSKTQATQMLDWWEVQRLQWAWPSQYPPPEGWKDRLRFKPTPKEIFTENWLSPSQSPSQSGSQLGSPPPDSPPDSPELSPLTTLSEKENEKEEERGEGNTPGTPRSTPGSTPSPPLTGLSLLKYLNYTFPHAFGKAPDSRESAQLRDLGEEISSAGGATAVQVYDAFKEACNQNKLSVSYVRAVLHAWLGRRVK